MRIKSILSGAALIAAAVFTALFGAGKISEKKSFAEEKPYKGVITVWQIDTFEGGTGSRKNFLLSSARGFEKKYAGVLVMVISHTETSANAAYERGETPDAISFGAGFYPKNAKKITPEKKFAGGTAGADCYAVPWCRGGYILIENPTLTGYNGAKKDKKSLPDLSEEEILVSEGEHTAPLVALSLADVRVKSVRKLSPMEAYVKYTEGKTRYYLTTQRDAVRLTRRGESFNYYPLSAYNDLYQYISLTSVSPEKSVYAERFIEYILKEEVQKSLGKICMFSAFYAAEQETEVLNDLQRIKSESTFSVFSAKESYKELQKLAELTATGKEKDLTKLKKFLA